MTFKVCESLSLPYPATRRGTARVHVVVLVLVVAVVIAGGKNACAEHRTALLIGNAEHDDPLTSSEADIKLVAGVLRKHGFRTVLCNNLKRDGLYDAIERFIQTAPINGTGLIYFNGEVVAGKSFDQRDTAILLGTEGNRKGVPLVELMEWLSLHSATSQNVIVVDDQSERPREQIASDWDGMLATELPANTWLGITGGFKKTSETRRRDASSFAAKFSTSNESSPYKLLTSACRWTKSTCRTALFSRPASRAVSPPHVFPGNANPGDEWVAPDGTVFCYCPPNSRIDGFWFGKYEVPLCKWPIPGLAAGVGPERNHPTTEQRLDEVLVRLASLTREERSAGRIPSDWEYGLPSAKQWEHAARAGSMGDRSFDDIDIVRHVNFADKSLLDTGHEHYLYADPKLDDGWARLAPVGSFRANSWGIHDVFGNVWEPTDKGVLRGGSWVSQPEYCRISIQKRPLKYPSDYVGLRIALRPSAGR